MPTAVTTTADQHAAKPAVDVDVDAEWSSDRLGQWIVDVAHHHHLYAVRASAQSVGHPFVVLLRLITSTPTPTSTQSAPTPTSTQSAPTPTSTQSIPSSASSQSTQSTQSSVAYVSRASWFRACSHIVSWLPAAPFKRLVQTLLYSVHWPFDNDIDASDAYSELILNMVSAHAGFVSPCLRRIVDLLRSTTDEHDDTQQQQDQPPQQQQQQQRRPLLRPRRERLLAIERLHAVLHAILRLVPAGPATLMPLLYRNFPHFREPAPVHKSYTQHLLRLIRNVPAMHDQVLDLIVEKMVIVDAEASGDWSTLSDDERDLLDTMMQQHYEQQDLLEANEPVVDEQPDAYDGEEGDNQDEDMLLPSDTESELSDFVQDETRQEVLERLLSLLIKMDNMMCLTFQYFEDAFPRNTMSPAHDKWPMLQAYFKHLIQKFPGRLFSTRYLTHTQYLLFYMTTLDSSFTEGLLACLLSQVFNSTEWDVGCKVQCVMFIASFVARAVHVDVEMCAEVTRVMVEGAVAVMERASAALSSLKAAKYTMFKEETVMLTSATSKRMLPPNAPSSRLFYALVNAVMYICCFRLSDLVEPDDDGVSETTRFLFSPMGIQRLLCTLWPFQPMRFCSHAVIRQFRRCVADRNDGILYCPDILKDVTKGDSATMTGEEVDAVCFPFDPFFDGRKWAKWVDSGMYRRWNGPTEDDAESESSDSSSSSSSNDDSDDEME